MKKKAKILITIILILGILCPIHFTYENTKLQITNYTITNESIPEYFNNFKIAQISDFHNTKNKTLTKDLVDEIKKQNPNIIVLTGDLIDANKIDIDTSINFIKEIKDISPIYFTTGNHEASISKYNTLKEKLEENNVIILESDCIQIKINESEINLIGIDDPRFINDSFIEDKEIIKNEISNTKYNKDNFTILLSHRPEVFATYVENNIDLVLTGHAHGGQIRIPFIGGLVAPNQGLFPKYTSGIFEEENTEMIVSRGIGNSILPFRINNRPELVIVTLNNN